MAKIINNPTDNDVQITIRGDQYVVKANGTSDVVSDGVAEKWVKTHGFLVATDAETPSVAKETIKPEANETPVEAEEPEPEVESKVETDEKKPKRKKKSSSK